MPRYIDADLLKTDYYALPKSLSSLTVSTQYVSLSQILNAPTVDVVEIRKESELEMFDLISSAYYGKQMYFKQDDGTVYSRYSCKQMSVDEAIREFISLIDDSDLPDVVVRCKDCKNFDICSVGKNLGKDGFCSKGK